MRQFPFPFAGNYLLSHVLKVRKEEMAQLSHLKEAQLILSLEYSASFDQAYFIFSLTTQMTTTRTSFGISHRVSVSHYS